MNRSFKKGFTLVELLIVIGILGILAIGLLAALNPVEQLRRGRDTSRMSSAREILGAMQRSYALYNTYPTGFTATSAVGPSLISSVNATITAMEASGELKSGYYTRLPTYMKSGGTTDGELTIYKEADSAGGNIAVCFDPESDGISLDTVNTTYTNGALAACVPSSSQMHCFWCVK